MLVRWQSIVCVFCIAMVVRATVALLALWGVEPFGPMTADPDAYRLIAETLATSGVFGITEAGGQIVDPTAFRPPLYPWLLSWFVTIGGEGAGRLDLRALAGLHVLLGTITSVATAISVDIWLRLAGLDRPLTRAWPPQVSAGVIAGTWVAVDPLLLMQSTLVMTETLATAIAAVVWMLVAIATAATNRRGMSQRGSTRKDLKMLAWGCWMTISLALAVGFLCRPTFVVWTAGILALLIADFFLGVCKDGIFRWRRLVIAFLIVATTGVTVFAWMERNRRAIGKPVWATTHGGYTLLLGNNPHFYQFLRERSFLSAGLWGEAWDAEPFHLEWQKRLVRMREKAKREQQDRSTQPVGSTIDAEIWEDRLAGDWAKETIASQKTMFLYSSLVRVTRLWNPFPRLGDQVTALSLGLGLYCLLVYLGCLMAVLKFRFRLMGWVWLSALMLVCSLTIVHAVYWSNIRMRAPAVPLLLGLATVGFVGGLKDPLGRCKH